MTLVKCDFPLSIIYLLIGLEYRKLSLQSFHFEKIFYTLKKGEIIFSTFPMGFPFEIFLKASALNDVSTVLISTGH